jgi:hypothetical protein
MKNKGLIRSFQCSIFNLLKSSKHCPLPIARCLLPIAYCLLPIAFASCNEQTVEYQANECKRLPAFVKQVGFNPAYSAFSTSEKRKMGLVLLQINVTGDTSNGGKKIYQHPSWKMAGWLGPIQLDPQGNCFVAPVPVINVLNNPAAQQNIIYKVDGGTGEMKEFTKLPIDSVIVTTNPYGILGFAYLCESNILYVSTVAGSDRQHERGTIFAIESTTGKIIDQLSGTDALGMGISYISGKRKLYFGSPRTSDVYSITLTSTGKFITKPAHEFSIEGIGPRGDDKVRRIKFDKAGTMQLYAIEFNFNLTAPTEKQESVYTCTYAEEEKTWRLVK